MKFFTLLTTCILVATHAFAQVGINTHTPRSNFHIDGAMDNPVTGAISNLQALNDFFLTTDGKIGIGTITPNTASVIDINSTNKGFLVSRVNLLSTTDNTTIINPPKGLMVYHEGNAALGPALFVNIGTEASPNWSNGQVEDFYEGRRVHKMVYSGNQDPNRTMEAGLFEWKIEADGANHTRTFARLLAPPPSGSITLSGPRLGWVSPGVLTSVSVNTTWTNAGSDWSTWKTVEGFASGAIHTIILRDTNSGNIYHINYYCITNQYTSLIVQVYR